MITNEKGFSKKLRKQLLTYGVETVPAETISKGFPDLLAIDTIKKKTYFLELKFSLSTNPNTHKKLAAPMQLHWLNKLPHAFLLVFVPGEDLFVYESYDKDLDALISITEITNTRDLVELLRG